MTQSNKLIQSTKKRHNKLHREMVVTDIVNEVEVQYEAEVEVDVDDEDHIEKHNNSRIFQKAIINRAEEFLVSHIKYRNYTEETVHPWRKDAKQVVLHSFRVYSYAEKIIVSEQDKLTSNEVLLIKLAAILHDIGKFYKKENHAQKSTEMVQRWIKENSESFEAIDTYRLLAIIEGHSNKDVFDGDLCSIILKDADILDEIGAMSIFMTSNWLDKTSPYFFHELSNRLQENELGFCNMNFSKLRTVCAKEIMNGKKAFIESFIIQLNSELEGTEEFYEFMKEN